MKQDFYLILPNIRSCHNVGAMFRCADACGVTKIYVVGYTPTPPRPEIAKVALGAETWVPWEQRKDLRRLVQSLQKKGVHVVALEKTSESQDIADWGRKKSTAGVALVVGNEVDGISQDILDLCDSVCHIPMAGKKESLNVSVAAGIGMYVLSEKVR